MSSAASCGYANADSTTAGDHHRVEHVFLGRTRHTMAQIPLKPTENEKAGLIERRWWFAYDLHRCQDKLLPPNLTALLDDIIAGRRAHMPLSLSA